jgi:hypothetical protein
VVYFYSALDTTLTEIQELAGHKAIQRSVRYAHLSPAHELAAVERIAKPALQTALVLLKGQTATKIAARSLTV